MGDTTRRQALSAATIGAAAVALAIPAGAQTAPGSQARGGMQDPRGKYPKPPFKAQSQPWPGLAGQMDPKPDHGETEDSDDRPGNEIGISFRHGSPGTGQEKR